MMKLLFGYWIAACVMTGTTNAEIITSPGEFHDEEFGVMVSVELSGESQAVITVQYLQKEGRPRGGFSQLPIRPGQWFAYFEPPNKLWIFDGKEELLLSERTTSPNGFKGSSLSKVPSLLEQAPEKVKAAMKAR